MKKKKIVGIIFVSVVVSVLVLGFVIGAILTETTSCTQMGCSCEGISGERPCNTCYYSDPIFMTGILNVVQQCSATEIITCENGLEVDKRIDLENKTCEINWFICGFLVRWL